MMVFHRKWIRIDGISGGVSVRHLGEVSGLNDKKGKDFMLWNHDGISLEMDTN